MTFGAYLTELRKGRRIAKNRLAQQLKVPFSTVNNWEAHGAAPTQSNMAKLIAALKLTPPEKTRLTELWLGMPGAKEKEKDLMEQSPISISPSSTPPTLPAEVALAQLLTRATDPAVHTVFDGVAVYRAINEAAGLVADLNVGEAEARAALDAAAALRSRGMKVNAASLVVAMLAPKKKDAPID
jgi:transcriptional regulator with XRE-family HTH domain